MTIYTRITANPETTTGRERLCVQCGTTYKSQRSTSSYCSTSCRKKRNRGTPQTGMKPDRWSVISKALHRAGYIGSIGPNFTTDNAPPTYGLLVPDEHALDELSFHFNRKGWGCVGRTEFSEALRGDGIQSFYTLSQQAMKAKLWRDRNTRRSERQS